jgi:hypothetical protein
VLGIACLVLLGGVLLSGSGPELQDKADVYDAAAIMLGEMHENEQAVVANAGLKWMKKYRHVRFSSSRESVYNSVWDKGHKLLDESKSLSYLSPQERERWNELVLIGLVQIGRVEFRKFAGGDGADFSREFE